MKGRAMDVTGRRYGRLVAQRWTGEVARHSRVWLCLCDCGKVRMVRVASLNYGDVQSCGCLHLESVARNGAGTATHGHARGGKLTRTYRIWANMLTRCTNPKATRYRNYGGRGIGYSDRWRSFENFLADMGEAPAGRSIDRINNDGNYEPTNCRWATPKEQAANRRKPASQPPALAEGQGEP